MHKRWEMWLILGGLGINLIDAFTTPAGGSGGTFYGPSGILASTNTMLPGNLKLGELMAMVGAGALLFTGQAK